MHSKGLFIALGLITLAVLTGCYDKSIDQEPEMVLRQINYPVYRKNKPIQGSLSSPVEMTYYFDYQCRWCRDFELNTLPQLKKYIDDGSLSITYKDYVFIGRDSMTAGLGSQCIFNEYGLDKFLKYHNLMYINQKTKNTGWITDELLENISEKISIDYAFISDCIDNKTYISLVKEDTDEGKFNGITSTPSFIINDKRLSGSLNIQKFESIIQSELIK